MSNVLRLASYPFLSYLPQHVADELGYFVDESLEVKLIGNDGGLGKLMTAIPEGRADIIIGNIWLCIRNVDGTPSLLPIANSNQHCRFVVASRASEGTGEAFDWKGLRGKTVMFGNDMPPPWIAFMEVLRRAELTLADIQIVTGFDPLKAIDEFDRGVADYIITDIDRVQDPRLVERAAMADVLDTLPWSVFCVDPSMVAERGDELGRFRTAIGRALAWIDATETSEIVRHMHHRFPSMTPDAMAGAIDRYRAIGFWAGGETVSLEALERWQVIMQRWGLITSPPPPRELLAHAG